MDVELSNSTAENTKPEVVLKPPAVTALRDRAAAESVERTPMERSVSMDIRAEREDLKQAAEQTMNVILDLDLDGTIRWVSPSWQEVVGTSPASVQGKPIAELLVENKTAFADTIESMQKDDSRSQIIRFSIAMGPSSVLSPILEPRDDRKEDDSSSAETQPELAHVLNLEAQGIMLYDRSSGRHSHVGLIVICT